MPSPLLRPIGGIRPIGSGLLRSRSPVEQYLPTQEDVQAQIPQVQQEDDTNFFFKLLEIPGRLLFGQSIQGGLEGGAQSFGEGARRAFVNNPFFQILEGVGLGEPVGNLLESVGLKQQGSVGLVEDTNFAKVREAWGWDAPEDAAAAFGLDLVGELVTSPLELFFTPFGYTSKGWQAARLAKESKLAAIGLKANQITPDLAKATETGLKTMLAFKVPFTDAGFSVWTPRALDLQAAKVIQGTADFLNKSPLISPLIQLFKRDQVVSADAEARFLGKEAVAKGDQAKYELESQMLTRLQKLLKDLPEEVKKNRDFDRLVTVMQEYNGFQGLDAVDSYASLIDYVKSRVKPDDAVRFEERLSEAAGVRTAGLSPDEFSTGTAKRSAISQQTPSAFQQTQDAFVGEDLPALLKNLEAADPTAKYFDSLAAYADGLDKLGEDLARIDGITRTANAALDGYFPRDLSDGIREAIDAKASDFTQGRKISEMSTLEANHFLMSHGTKLLGYRSVDDLANNLGENAAYEVMRKVFPEEFVNGLKAKFGDEAQGITEFFNTNPVTAWHKRIQKSAKIRQYRAMMDHLVGKGSPAIIDDLTLKDFATNPDLIAKVINEGKQPIIVSGKGNVVFRGDQAVGEMLDMSGKLNVRASAATASMDVDDWLFNTRLEGKRLWEDEIKDLEAAGGIRVRYKTQPMYSLESSKNLDQLKSRAERLSVMESDLAALEASRFKDHPLTQNLRDQIDYVRDWANKGDNRVAELKDMVDKEKAMREGIQNSLDRAKADYKEFRDAAYGLSNDKEKAIRLVKQDGLKDIERTRHFEDLFQMWRSFKANGVSALDELAKRDPELFAKFTDKFQDMRVVTIDQENYDAFLDPKKGLFSRLNKPDRASRILGLYDDATALWKTWTLNPVFQATRARDVASNVVMQLQGGARPNFRVLGNRFVKSLDEALKTGNMDLLKTADVPRHILEAMGAADGEEVFHMLQKYGVISPNILTERYTVGVGEKVLDLSQNVPLKDLPGLGKKVNEIMTRASLARTKFGRWGQRLAETLDADTRIGAFFDHLEQGKGVEEAAATVVKWGYDPRRTPLTSFERNVLRRFIPFYSFAKTAVGMQMEALMTKPGTVTWFKKVSDAANKMNGLSDAEKEAYLPEYVTSNFGIPTRIDGGVAKVWMFGSLLPIGQVGEITNAIVDSFNDESPNGFVNYAGKQLNPLLKTMVENLRNDSFFQQRAIERFPGERVNYLGIDMSPKLKNVLVSIRFANELNNLGVFTSEDVKRAMAAKTATGQDQSFFERLLYNSAVSPLSPLLKRNTVDLERQIDYSMRREQAQLSKAKADLGRAIRDPDKDLSEANIETLKQLIAKRQARIQLIQESAGRIGR